MKLSRLAHLRARIMRTIGPRLVRTSAFRPRLIGWRARPVDGNICDESLAIIMGVGDLIGATPEISGSSPAQARAQMAESSLMVEDEVCPDVLVEDLTLEHEGARVPARKYVPKSLPKGSPGVVYYHGGGFVLGDLDTHDRYCQVLARDASVRVIAVDYRLAPENPFPAAVDDATLAFRCVARNAAKFDMDPARLAVAGDSAGGNLSAVVARKTRQDTIRPALQVLIYPAVDALRSMKSHKTFAQGWLLTAEGMEWFYHNYVGDDPAARGQVDVSPLLTDDFDGLPPALVYTAGFDPLRDEGMAYAERLEKAGIPVKQHCFLSLTHGFASMGGLCQGAREAALHISRDVERALREGLPARTEKAA
jgi:acetyl esterase